MNNMADHYESLLASHYSWAMGGGDENIAKNEIFFKKFGLIPKNGGRAVDLGAGSGFQSIPLARLGFAVTALDLSPSLLKELDRQCGKAPVTTVEADLTRFPEYLDGPVELIVCMGDTLAHLPSRQNIDALFRAVHDHLEPGGKFVLSFRDQSRTPEGTDRFFPVRSEPGRIFTCFVEYSPDKLLVHDLLYVLEGEKWTLHKGSYPKLRLTASEITENLSTAGFKIEESSVERGLATVIASV